MLNRNSKLVLGALMLLIAAAGTASADDASMVRTNTWQGGGGIGFLAETPDDMAFAVNLNADYFLDQYWSIGPLLQLGFTDDLAQYGASAQLKYWFTSPDTAGRWKPYVGAGVGMVHAAFREDDTSWLVPLQAGLQYRLDNFNLYGEFLLNLTDLDTGRGTEADVMPGLNFGIQF